jgi:lipoprotein-anchoring transpeptidase ErfK/SrfK
MEGSDLKPPRRGRYLHIQLGGQRLTLVEDGEVLFQAPISSAANGPGEQNGSGCTPRGWHCIRAKIGDGAVENTVFIGRRPSGEVYDEALAREHPGRDWILTRILWLSGLEKGRNRLGQVDSMRRYIYIHGTPDSEPMGEAKSHGCIRMHNKDIIRLFDLVPVYTRVFIEE